MKQYTQLLLILAWLLVMAPVAAFAATDTGLPAPLALPAPAAAAASVGDPVLRTVLPNGLTVLIKDSPREGLVAIEVLVNAGLVEEKGRSGLANLTMEMLFRQLKGLPPWETALKVEGMGTSFSASGGADFGRITCLTERSFFNQSLDILASTMKDPDFSDEELARRENDLAEQLTSQQSAYYALYDIFLQNFYRYHPYRKSVLGTPQTIIGIKLDDIRQFHQLYFSPERIVISVVGDVDRAQVLSRIEQTFGTWASHSPLPTHITWEPPKEEREVFLSTGSPISWVLIGYPAPGLRSPDYFPMRMLEAVLGEGLGSRIWNELREKRGLVYEVECEYPELAGPSHILFRAVSKPQNAEQVRKRMLWEIDKMKKQPVTVGELEQAQEKILGSYLLERETRSGEAYNLARAELMGLGYGFDLGIPNRIFAVTADDIQRVANTYLNNHTMIVAYPSGASFPMFGGEMPSLIPALAPRN